MCIGVDYGSEPKADPVDYVAFSQKLKQRTNTLPSCAINYQSAEASSLNAIGLPLDGIGRRTRLC